MLDQIVNIVREGQTKRAPMEQIADVMTTYFVPVITLVAILTWVVWMSLGLSGRIPSDWLDVSSGGWVAWSLQFATAVFVVACPCGLALAAPTAIFVGGGLAAKHGILAKGGGEAFEKASKIDCVVFDKTGTLTMGGEPSITDSEIYPDNDDVDEARKATFLAALKAVEENSSHPIANAIVSFCASKTSDCANIDNLEEIPGKGMKATYTGSHSESSFQLIVGNEAFMNDFSVHISPVVAALLQKWKIEAKSIALAATKPISPPPGVLPPAYSLAAALSISDRIRPEAPAIIRALHNRGTAVWLLSGDNQITATTVAAQLNINPDNVIADVLPTQKAEKIKHLQSTLKARINPTSESTTQRATIVMVGDGINDSPALTTADVGVAIGSGSDVAISSADFVLLNPDLRSVVNLLDLSRAVFRRIKFNFGRCHCGAELPSEPLNPDPELWLRDSNDCMGVIKDKWTLNCRVDSDDAPTLVDGEKGSVSEEMLREWMMDERISNEFTHFACIMDPVTGRVPWLRRGPAPQAVKTGEPTEE
ncbi:hypothetical protein ACJZ2D_017048 [Fusarium nematophilum]